MRWGERLFIFIYLCQKLYKYASDTQKYGKCGEIVLYQPDDDLLRGYSVNQQLLAMQRQIDSRFDQ